MKNSYGALMTERCRRQRANASTAKANRRWRAVKVRDPRADGRFVYAVQSTGIYCRPTCPARTPQRRRVLFFAQPKDAERSGFRPCRRCHPDVARLRDPALDAIVRVCNRIDARVGGESTAETGESGELSLAALGAHAGMSPHQLERAFRRALGVTPRQYADARRLRRLKSLLKRGGGVTRALYEAGYGSSSRLYERAPAHLGMTPAEYARGADGMRIQYTIVASPLGRLLVGATRRGVSAVYLGDSDADLLASLRKEYPGAEIERADRARNRPAELSEWVRRILGHLRGREPNLDLPTDVRATAFQRCVWQELRRIPYGATRTYREIACAIGRPEAVRAVARACSANPVAVLVPCHRVVRSDKALAGYRWGIDRKGALIEMEQATISSKRRSFSRAEQPGKSSMRGKHERSAL